jgi:hypothetical protein
MVGVGGDYCTVQISLSKEVGVAQKTIEKTFLHNVHMLNRSSF